MSLSLDLSTLTTLSYTLKSLHNPSHPLLLANVWDAASATLIAQHPSTHALATASYAIAATQGISDSNLTLPQNLAGIRNVVAGLRNAGLQDAIPLTVDLQDGYADPAETTRVAIREGAVGCNIEDVDNGTGALRGLEDAVERIRIVLGAATEMGLPGFVVNARTDVLGFEGGGIAEVIERGKAFLEAGATTVFVWGVGKWEIHVGEVEEMVRALGGRVAVQPGVIGVERLRGLGVARISVGPALWRGCMGVLEVEGVKIGVLGSGTRA